MTFDQLRRCERVGAYLRFEWDGVTFTFVPTAGHDGKPPKKPILIGSYDMGKGSPPMTFVQVGVPISLEDNYKNRLELLRLIENIARHVGVHVQCERAFRRTNGLSKGE